MDLDFNKPLPIQTNGEVFSGRVLVRRQSEFLSNVSDSMLDQIALHLTVNVVRWLERNRISGPIVLEYSMMVAADKVKMQVAALRKQE
jgi:hypothetical protein